MARRHNRRRDPRQDGDQHGGTASRRLRRTAWILGAVLALTAAGVLRAREIEVTGRVLAGNGQALAGAEVELLPLLPPHENARRLLARSLPEAIATARSDREGRFRVAAPQPGMWRIVVRHPAHLAMTCHLRPLLYDRALPEVQLLDRSQRSFKVVDEQGQPVAGLFLATVSWPNQKRPPRPPKGWLPEVSYLETAADGTVTVAGHPDAVVLLASVHDDRFLLKTLPWNDRKDELHLVEPMLPVRLVDPRGRPAANLFGDIEWLAFYFPVGISDKDGEILLPSRPAHRVRIAFFDGDGTYPRGVAKEKSDEETVLRLPAVTMLDGRVLDPGGTAIAGALVWSEGIHLRTDRNGAFRLRAVNTEETRFQVAAPGFLIAKVQVSPLDLAAGSERTVVLEPTIEVRGRLVESAGEGVAHAAIRAKPGIRMEYGPGGPRSYSLPVTESRTATSSADGRFALRGLATELPYRVTVRHPGYAPVEVELPPQPAGSEPEELLLTLEAGLRAFGQVLDGEQLPIAGAEVRLLPARRRLDRWGKGREDPMATTDATGRFELRDLAHGVYSLQAVAPGYSRLTVPGIEITEGIDLGTVILETGVSLRGRVTDREDRPIEGARVMARSMPTGHIPLGFGEVKTGPDGSFQLDALSPPVYVDVSLAGFQGALLPDVVPDPEKPLHIVLEPGIPLAVEVVDERGRPVPRARVHLRNGASSGDTVCDSEGRFEWTDLAPGRTMLGVRSEMGIADPVEIELAHGRERREVRLVLRPAGRLRGRVIDADGAAVANARVVVEPQAHGALGLREEANTHHESTDTGGQFTVGNLGGGTYRLRVSHPELEPVTEVIEVTAGVTREVELVMGTRHARLRIAGQVIGATGEAVGGAVIRLISGHREFGQSASAPSGAFEISVPRPGKYALLVDHPDYAFRRTETRRIDEPLDGVVVELDQGSVVSGAIHGIGTAELFRLQIWLETRIATVSDDGRYRITGIPEGEWWIHARLPQGTSSLSEKVKVGPPGDAVELDLDFATRNRLLGLVLLDGAPLGGARVFARCGEKGLIPSRITRSDGRFEFDRIPTGRCRLLIHHQLGIRAFRQLEIEGDREVVFDLRPKTVSGQVLSAADLTPLADVRIELFVEARHPSHQTRTDATGRFTLSGVEPGVWPLWASRPGHAMARTRVEVGPEDAGEARILMNPARRAELVVRNPDGTVPPSVQVTVTGASGHFTSYRFQPDSQGRIVLDVLCAGTWSLRISGDRGEAQIEIEIPGPPVRVELTSP